MNDAAIFVAAQLAHRESHSALPNAPVVPDRPKGRNTRTVRRATARALRRAADRLQPAGLNYG